MSPMLEDLFRQRTLTARIGFSDEPSRAAPYLRAMLAFVKEIPGLGWALKGGAEALKELSEAEDDEVLEQIFQDMVDVGKQTQDQIAFLGIVSAAIYDQQVLFGEALARVNLAVPAASVPLLAKAGAITAYRSRVAHEHQYVDHRGIQGGGAGGSRFFTATR